MQYPNFNYKITTFRKVIPKNLVRATLDEEKQNTYHLHENGKRAAHAINTVLKKIKTKELMLPSSTLDICLDIICNPALNNKEENRNPLNLNPVSTKFLCDRSSDADWLASLKKKTNKSNYITQR